MMLESFTRGNRDLINRLNELVAIARQVQNMTGDDRIKVRHTASGINISMDRQRRSSGGGGGGGGILIKATIVRELMYPDAARDPDDGPTEGYDQYVCRLDSFSAPDWDIYKEYQIGEQVLGSDGSLYTARTVNTGNDPINSPSHWELTDEVTPRVLNYDSDETLQDKRWFIPFFRKDDVVYLIRIDGAYYFAEQLIRVNDGDGGSLAWNDTDDRAMAVYR